MSLPFGLLTSPRGGHRPKPKRSVAPRSTIQPRSQDRAPLTTRLGYQQGISQLFPTQTIQFLCAIRNFHTGWVRPSSERVTNTQQTVRSLLNSPTSPARHWMRALGLMASLVYVVPLCSIRMRPLRLHLLNHYVPEQDILDTRVPINGFDTVARKKN